MGSYLEIKLSDIINLDNTENVDEALHSTLLRQLHGFPSNSEIEETESKISNVLLSLNMREVKRLKSNFVYNFFQKNERVSEINSDFIINQNGTTTSTSEIENKLRQIPRYNEITWERTNGSNTNIPVEQIINLNSVNVLKENMISNKEFIKINIKDEYANEQLYKNLETSLLLTQPIDNRDSSLDMANKTIALASNRAGLTGQTKKILIENFTKMKPTGITFASTDYRAGNEKLSNLIDDNVNFNLTINRKLANSIVKFGSSLKENIFQNEFDSINAAADFITNKYLEDFQNNQITNNSELDFMLIIGENYLYDIVERDPNSLDINNLDPAEIYLVGYKIEKYELMPNGGIQRYDDIYLSSPYFLKYNDIKIKYGSKYRYIVKNVYKVKKSFIGLTSDESGIPRIFNACFYIESEGKTTSTECIESIPPKPPASFNIGFDYKNKFPILRWNFPSNPQQDIKKFQIFKRNTVNEPFTVLAEYDFDDSVEKTSQVLEQILPQNKYILNNPTKKYIDYRFKVNDNPIYAIAAVDAHGMTSNYSRQLQFSYNKRENTFRIKMISIENAPKQYPNIYINRDTFVDTMKSSGKDRLNLFFNPEYYQVFKSNLNEISQEDEVSERNLNLIAANAIHPTYSIQILNIDNQKDKIINIRIKDKSGNYVEYSPNAILAPADYLI